MPRGKKELAEQIIPKLREVEVEGGDARPSPRRSRRPARLAERCRWVI